MLSRTGWRASQDALRQNTFALNVTESYYCFIYCTWQEDFCDALLCEGACSVSVDDANKDTAAEQKLYLAGSLVRAPLALHQHPSPAPRTSSLAAPGKGNCAFDATVSYSTLL